jgi:ABC-type lipoprotein release transport system permease subunit
MFAVVLALIMESMNTGQHEQMISSALRFGTGYLQILDTAYVTTPSLDFSFRYDSAFQNRLNNVVAENSYIVPRVESFVLASGDRQVKGGVVLGIVPHLENRMNGLAGFLVEGEPLDENRDDILLGKGFAQRLSVSLGDTLVALGQGFQGALAAGKFRIAGIIEHPIERLNNQVIYMNLKTAAHLFNMENRVSKVMILAENEQKAIAMESKLREELDNPYLDVYYWKTLEPDLVKAVAFDAAAGRVFQLILYLVIGFGIFGTILTMTLERQKEFAIMVSIGMQRYWLATQCFFETVMMSFLGVFAGLALGFPLLFYFYLNPIPLGDELGDLMKEYGMEPFLPMSISLSVFVFQGISVFIIALLVTIFPVYKSLSFNLQKGLRR